MYVSEPTFNDWLLSDVNTETQFNCVSEPSISVDDSAKGFSGTDFADIETKYPFDSNYCLNYDLTPEIYSQLLDDTRSLSCSDVSSSPFPNDSTVTPVLSSTRSSISQGSSFTDEGFENFAYAGYPFETGSNYTYQYASTSTSGASSPQVVPQVVPSTSAPDAYNSFEFGESGIQLPASQVYATQSYTPLQYVPTSVPEPYVPVIAPEQNTLQPPLQMTTPSSSVAVSDSEISRPIQNESAQPASSSSSMKNPKLFTQTNLHAKPSEESKFKRDVNEQKVQEKKEVNDTFRIVREYIDIVEQDFPLSYLYFCDTLIPNDMPKLDIRGMAALCDESIEKSRRYCSSVSTWIQNQMKGSRKSKMTKRELNNNMRLFFVIKISFFKMFSTRYSLLSELHVPSPSGKMLSDSITAERADLLNLDKGVANLEELHLQFTDRLSNLVLNNGGILFDALDTVKSELTLLDSFILEKAFVPKASKHASAAPKMYEMKTPEMPSTETFESSPFGRNPPSTRNTKSKSSSPITSLRRGKSGKVNKANHTHHHHPHYRYEEPEWKKNTLSPVWQLSYRSPQVKNIVQEPVKTDEHNEVLSGVASTFLTLTTTLPPASKNYDEDQETEVEEDIVAPSQQPQITMNVYENDTTANGFVSAQHYSSNEIMDDFNDFKLADELNDILPKFQQQLGNLEKQLPSNAANSNALKNKKTNVNAELSTSQNQYKCPYDNCVYSMLGIQSNESLAQHMLEMHNQELASLNAQNGEYYEDLLVRITEIDEQREMYNM